KTAGNTSSAINGDGKLQVDSGGVAGGACLGRGFAPTNFDMSVDMAWNTGLNNSLWAGIA
ncbi:hypothetical protein LLG39_05810, partial [bacterium]|nr:hypothetical protein [bacterium]